MRTQRKVSPIRVHRKTNRSSSLRALALLPCLAVIILGGCRAQQPWPFWEAYTSRFLDGQGRIIDRSAGDRTTSEGQAYALFFALVDNDQRHFDQLLSWTEANLAGGDLTMRLPAWHWGKDSSGQWRTLDENSASDADVWMAYTLMEAGRLWHDPRYSRLGQQMAARIAREEVVLAPGLGTVLVPAPHGFHPDDQTYVLNPSYVPLPVLTYLAGVLPQGPWGGILQSLPALLDKSMDHGFAMDWVLADGFGVRPSGPPAEPSAGAREPVAAGSYDAIRVYLWLGLSDAATPGRAELLDQLTGMKTYMRTSAAPPVEVDPQGTILHADGPVGFSAALVPFLSASGLKAQARTQADRLLAGRDPATGLYGRGSEYYDQNLALFSTAFLEQRFRFERDGKLVLKWK